MLYTVSAMGVKHVVLRKVDGAEILRRIEEHGVTLMCGAPAVVTAVLEAAKTWDGEIPGRTHKNTAARFLAGNREFIPTRIW